VTSVNRLGVRNSWVVMVAAGVLAVLPAAAWADDPASAAPAAEPGVDVTGFVDGYYGYNFNKPVTNTNALHVFDVDHNSLGLALVEVAFEKKPVTGSPVGFRADLNFGPAAEISNAFEPGDPTILDKVQQGYVSWLPSPKVQLDFGKFVTFVGAELVESKDDWNYTRSIQFGYAIPIYHAGLRATVTASDKLTLAGYLVNGWNDVKDNNSAKTFGAQFTAKPSAKVTLVGGGLVGKEGASEDTRVLVDTILTLAPTSKVSFMGNYDYGKEGDAKWQAVSVYARLQASETVAFSPRFEYLDDSDGFMTTVSQKLTSFTLTSEVKLGGALLTRLDLRVDHSDTPIFPNDTADVFKKNQTTATLGVVYAFGGKLKI
jgi:Putative beta-barrel porin-2, OmpL-like. bbp2